MKKEQIGIRLKNKKEIDNFTSKNINPLYLIK